MMSASQEERPPGIVNKNVMFDEYAACWERLCVEEPARYPHPDLSSRYDTEWVQLVNDAVTKWPSLYTAAIDPTLLQLYVRRWLETLPMLQSAAPPAAAQDETMEAPPGSSVPASSPPTAATTQAAPLTNSNQDEEQPGAPPAHSRQEEGAHASLTPIVSAPIDSTEGHAFVTSQPSVITHHTLVPDSTSAPHASHVDSTAVIPPEPSVKLEVDADGSMPPPSQPTVKQEREQYLNAGPALPSAAATRSTWVAPLIIPGSHDYRSTRGDFEFDTAIRFRFSSSSHYQVPSTSREKFDNGSSSLSDARVLVWLSRPRDEKHQTLEEDLTSQWRALASLVPHAKSELVGLFPHCIESLARIGGTTKNSIAIRLSKPLAKFKFDHKLALYTLQNFAVFSLREWAAIEWPMAYGEEAARHIPCMFKFSTYQSCKLRQCAFNHEPACKRDLDKLRHDTVSQARHAGIPVAQLAHDIAESKRKQSRTPQAAASATMVAPSAAAAASSSVLPKPTSIENGNDSASTVYMDDTHTHTSSSSRGESHSVSSSAYSPQILAATLIPPPERLPPPSIDESALQRLLNDCVVAPPSSSVLATFHDDLPAPSFNLPSFERLHKKLSQDQFDRYFTVCRRRRIQWTGCPLEVSPEGPNRWRVPDANNIWARLQHLILAAGDTADAKAGRDAALMLVFINRSVESQNVVLHFRTEEAARTLVKVVCAHNARMGGLFQVMGRAASTREQDLPALKLDYVPIASIERARAASAATAPTALSSYEGRSSRDHRSPTRDHRSPTRDHDDHSRSSRYRSSRRSRSHSPRRRSRSRSRSRERADRDRANRSRQPDPYYSSYSTTHSLHSYASSSSSSSRSAMAAAAAASQQPLPDLYLALHFSGQYEEPSVRNADVRDIDLRTILVVSGLPLTVSLSSSAGIQQDLQSVLWALSPMMGNFIGHGQVRWIARTRDRGAGGPLRIFIAMAKAHHATDMIKHADTLKRAAPHVSVDLFIPPPSASEDRRSPTEGHKPLIDLTLSKQAPPVDPALTFFHGLSTTAQAAFGHAAAV